MQQRNSLFSVVLAKRRRIKFVWREARLWGTKTSVLKVGIANAFHLLSILFFPYENFTFFKHNIYLFYTEEEVEDMDTEVAEDHKEEKNCKKDEEEMDEGQEEEEEEEEKKEKKSELKILIRLGNFFLMKLNVKRHFQYVLNVNKIIEPKITF